MKCPKCDRKRYAEKVIKRAKRNFLIKQCLSCEAQFDLIEVHKSKVTNEWIEKDSDDK